MKIPKWLSDSKGLEQQYKNYQKRVNLYNKINKATRKVSTYDEWLFLKKASLEVVFAQVVPGAAITVCMIIVGIVFGLQYKFNMLNIDTTFNKISLAMSITLIMGAIAFVCMIVLRISTYFKLDIHSKIK